jgi:hypothetical protein
MKQLIKYVVVFAFSVELTALLGSVLGVFLVNDVPLAYRGAVNGNGLQWRTDSELWGSWHKPNFVDRHVKSCFDVEYASNAWGMRDSNVAIGHDERRIAVVGDSLAEGYAMKAGAHISDLLELELGIEVLNFGSGGNFGPVQYYLIYKNLVSKFEHDELFIFFAPGNDFMDNDLGPMVANGQATHNTDRMRYRPYARLDPPYEIFYPEGSVPSERYGLYSQGVIGDMKLALINYFWVQNPIKSIYYIFHGQAGDEKEIYSGYFDATEEQQNMTLFYLKKLVDEAALKGVRTSIFLFPGKHDLRRLEEVGYNSVFDQLWFKKLKSWESRGEVELLDLLPYFSNHSNKWRLFHSCDGHYSELGHRLSTATIVERRKAD